MPQRAFKAAVFQESDSRNQARPVRFLGATTWKFLLNFFQQKKKRLFRNFLKIASLLWIPFQMSDSWARWMGFNIQPDDYQSLTSVKNRSSPEVWQGLSTSPRRWESKLLETTFSLYLYNANGRVKLPFSSASFLWLKCKVFRGSNVRAIY